MVLNWDVFINYSFSNVCFYGCGFILCFFVTGSEIMGLAERFVIIANGQYIFVLALKTYRTYE
ncbi:MAG: hypothetical protein ACFFAQ_02640 [Promethearchaeota archaeon]